MTSKGQADFSESITRIAQRMTEAWRELGKCATLLRIPLWPIIRTDTEESKVQELLCGCRVVFRFIDRSIEWVPITITYCKSHAEEDDESAKNGKKSR